MTAREIFEAALNVDPQLRDAFVRDTCDKDAEKLQAVRGLLEAHASPAPEGWIDATRTGREPESDAVKFTPGARVGDYEILGVLGKGGNG
jgi:hypothetical protein